MISKYQLVMRNGPTPGKIYELDQDSLTIGRDVSNAIVINDAEISRRHARLVLQAGGYLIEDTGSTNGTFINQQRLMGPHLLKHGETINLGDNVVLAFEQMQFDPDATMVSPIGAPAPEAYQAPVQPAPTAYQQPAYQQPAYQPPAYQQPVQQPVYPPPAYQQPVYQQPEAYAPAVEPPYEVEEEKKKPRTGLFLGIGCLVILLCILIGAAFAFDQLNLYCVPPFDALFACP